MVDINSNVVNKFVSLGLMILFLMGSFNNDVYVQLLCLLALPASLFGMFFSMRHSWLLYGPLSATLLLPLVYVTFYNDDLFPQRYFWAIVVGLVTLLFAGSGIEVINNLIRRKKSQTFYKEISESRIQRNTVLFNEEAIKFSGMSNQDREFFRNEMLRHHKKYEYLCKVEPDVKKYLPTYSQDLKVMNGIFNELLNAPLQFLSASDFLYRDLNDYEVIVRGMENILDNTVKDRDDEKVLRAAKVKTNLISNNLRNDFKKITDNERLELEKNLKQIQQAKDEYKK